MKVYVFVVHAAHECEFYGVRTELYKTHQEAQDAFNRWKDDEMEYVNDYGYDINVDEIDHFEASEYGNYCNEHTEGFIDTFEI